MPSSWVEACVNVCSESVTVDFEPLDQALDRDLPALPARLLGRLLLGETIAFDHVVLEHSDHARHLADLVAALGVAEINRIIAFGEPTHGLCQAEYRRADAAVHDEEAQRRDGEAERQHRTIDDKADTRCAHLRPGGLDHLRKRGIGDVDIGREHGRVELGQLGKRHVDGAALAQRLDQALLPFSQCGRIGLPGARDRRDDGGRRIGARGCVEHLAPGLDDAAIILRSPDQVGRAPRLSGRPRAFDPHRERAAIGARRPSRLLDADQLVDRGINQLQGLFEIGREPEDCIEIFLSAGAKPVDQIAVPRRLLLAKGAVRPGAQRSDPVVNGDHGFETGGELGIAEARKTFQHSAVADLRGLTVARYPAFDLGTGRLLTDERAEKRAALQPEAEQCREQLLVRAGQPLDAPRGGITVDRVSNVDSQSYHQEQRQHADDETQDGADRKASEQLHVAMSNRVHSVAIGKYFPIYVNFPLTGTIYAGLRHQF